MNIAVPSESKVAILSIALMMVVFTANGCNHTLQLIGLTAVSGLGGFKLGLGNETDGERTKTDGSDGETPVGNRES